MNNELEMAREMLEKLDERQLHLIVVCMRGMVQSQDQSQDQSQRKAKEASSIDTSFVEKTKTI